MKKNSIYAFIIAIGLMLSACGSNDKPDGVSNPANPGGGGSVSGEITTALQSITIDKSSGNVNANVRVTSTYASSVVATLNSMDISLGGCALVAGSVSANPDTVTLDSATPSRDVVLTGTMTDPSCVPNSYQLTGTNTILENGKTTTEAFTAENVTIPLSSITFEDSSVLKLEVIKKQLDINVSSAERVIDVHLSQGVKNVADKNIKVVGAVESGSFASSLETTDDFGNASFAYTAPDPIVDNNFSVEFCLEENSSICDTVDIHLTTGAVPDTNDTPDTGNDFINYGMTFTSEDGKFTLGLEKKKAFKVTLIDLADNSVISPAQIEKITITSTRSNALKLLDPFDPVGAAVDKLEFEGKNDVNLFLKSFTIAGLADIDIVIDYKNTKGFKRQVKGSYAITIFSGPPTAFTIISEGLEYDDTNQVFKHHFGIHAVDRHTNAINTSSTFSASGMAGFAKDSNGERMLYGKISKDERGITANIEQDGNNAKLSSVAIAPFTDFDTDTLRGVDLDRDFVAVFGGVRVPEAAGGWKINSIESSNSLILDQYTGGSYSNLGFAIGHNYREKTCSLVYARSLIKVYATTGDYNLDVNGVGHVTIEYPPYMVGKRVFLTMNLIGKNPETDVLQKHGEVFSLTLRSNKGLYGATWNIPGNTTARVKLWGSINTESEDSFPLFNSVFSCFTNESTGIVSSDIVEQNLVSDCNTTLDQDGRAFVIYEVTSGAEDATFTLSGCHTNTEFIF